MRSRKKINIASLWIIVIFTVIAITVAALFVLVYHSVLQKELHTTLRDQADMLADSADAKLVDAMQNQVAQRLAAKDQETGYIHAFASQMPSSAEIRALTTYFTEINAAFSQTDRVEIYFPFHRMIVGSQGVHFLNDKKYERQQTEYDYLLQEASWDMKWLRVSLAQEGGEEPYILFVRAYPGVFTAECQPLLILSVAEASFHAMLRSSLRTLGQEDAILLVDAEGRIWSAPDEALIDTVLPVPEFSMQSCVLADGQEVVLAEAASLATSWHYVLAHPSSGRITGYDTIFLVWAAVCLLLLLAGLVSVLWVLMKHYARPMRRLIHAFPMAAETEDGKRLSAPIEHFLKIETALNDMSKIKQEQEAFLSENQPLLREAWLNCFIRGEAHYLAPQPQLGIDFPHAAFQVVIAYPAASPQEKEQILSAFDTGAWAVAAFESREKESVFLFNHDFDETALAKNLEELNEPLEQMGSSLVFGVGILAAREDLVPASFRCARRALSSRYFEKKQRVAVFNPGAHYTENENAMTQVISQLTELTSLIRHQSLTAVNQRIDAIVQQLKESAPYPNVMRSIMLLAAMFLAKVVYDMKGLPEEVYGDDLFNAYYHIEGISEFAQRLKQDSAKLSAYLSRESSASNRSVVQYAIHHIRNCPPDQLSAQSIADALGISTGHLSRMFHQETGRKLVDYLQEIRMEHAARLLAENALTNEEICEKIGYSRLPYFSLKFKEHYGLTPNEYRRQCRYGHESI